MCRGEPGSSPMVQPAAAESALGGGGEGGGRGRRSCLEGGSLVPNSSHTAWSLVQAMAEVSCWGKQRLLTHF